MRPLTQLRKKQVGLRLPEYLVNDIDSLAQEHQLNRSDVIIESIKSYIQLQADNEFINSFDKSCKELKEIIKNPEKSNSLKTLDDLIDEL